MNQPMFRRTGGADFPDKLKVMVTGPPKSGKTTLLGTIPNIVIADTEPHANNLQSLAHKDVPYVPIYSSADLQNLRLVLANDSLRQQAAESLGMDAIEAVAIDTFDTFQKILKRERLAETRQRQFLRDDWGWMKEELTKIIEAFTALPLHVVFTVHTKTKEVGTQDNPRTIYLPGLEGAIAEDIAGMVGYSLLAFRDQQIRPDGSKFTKYWLRAEGDETYEFLGNRSAGRLPDVLEPDFGTIYAAAMAARPQPTEQQPVEVPKIQTTGQTQAPAPEAASPQQPQQEVVQNPAQSERTAPAQPSQPEGAAAPQPVDDRPADNEPVNAAALQHVKKIYDACGLPLPEEKLKAITIGDARTLVKMWRGVQQDHAEGKAESGTTPVSNMIDYLGVVDLMPDGGVKAQQASPRVEADPNGTIEQVKAYVGDDLGRVTEAYNAERNGKARKSLLEWLESKGAQPSAPEPTVQTNVQNGKAPETSEAVTSQAGSADAEPTEGEAVQAVQEGLGGEVVGQEIRQEAPCEECGGPLDDLDIAQLSKARYGRVLCVNDYLAEGKKPASV